jgi:hypothetical protein
MFHKKRGGTVWMLGENFLGRGWRCFSTSPDWSFLSTSTVNSAQHADSRNFQRHKNTVDVERKDQSGLVEKGDYL